MPPWVKDWFAVAIDHEHVSGPRSTFPTLEYERYAMLKRIVLAGNCISAGLRSTIIEELEDGLIRILPLHAPELTTHAEIVRLPDRTLSPIAVALIERIEGIASES